MQKLNHESVEEFNHTKKRKKKLNHTQKIALVLLCILSIAFIQQCRANGFSEPRITDFTASPSTVDVGEPVNLTWTTIGFFDIAVISYGDGNQTQMTMVEENKTYTILHEYQSEGKYNVSIYVANTITTDEDWDAQFITIQNDPPVFDISIDPSQADEDEFVNVSVTNLQESDHDKEPGLLTYVFDFADGNQTTSNSSSILHKWENGGTYPITVTVIDDQNALNQKTQDILIGNKVPEPDFTIGCEIPSTYGFYSDLIGAFPFGWTSIDKHYEGSYSFVGEVGKNGTDISFLDSTNYGDKFVVIDEFNDHKEVLRCESYGYNAQHFECGVAEGTIEYWFAGWTEKRTLQYLRTDGGDAIQFRTNDLGESDFFQYYNGSDWVSVANASDYDWFHIRFDFDCVTDIYHIYVNEELVASDIDFLNNGTEIDNFYIEPDEWTGGTYYSYFDAFGFSWDPNYNVGDNLYAHESFDAFRVAEGADYHQKILEAKWTEFHDVEIYNTYEPQPNGTVEFWFMTSDTTVDQLCGFSFYDDQGLENFKIFIQNSKWYYSTPAVYQIPNVNDPKNNTWHHVRIDFLAEGQYLDLNPSTFKVTIDGIESGLLNMNYNEDHYPQSMHMKVDKEVGYDGVKSRIDAIGYSWDPHYEIGYNHKIFIKEYYATFDFSEEIIGTEPSENDWYIPPPPSSKDGSFSIIDAGDFGLSDPGETGGDIDGSDPNDEVVEIFDNSTSNSLIMEHNYTNQAYGSVELWIRSNNTHEKVWVFCLMQNDVLGLALLMDNDEWQYTINDVNYEIIDGNIDPPENDTWYHVRIDFRCTGADPYFSLQEGHFTVSINTVLSSQYQMTPSLTSINRTRVTTGGSDTGTAYIDAIGYSWDPYYQIGDNRFPMVHYPEKSLIWFSASQTTDTSNDEDSLSYYWDFGDGSSDFGKYVAHEYPTSGMYPVELTVMDDNGAKSSKTRIVLISNKYPDINFSSFKDEITTFEGTTIIFDTIVDDENPDVARMEYYWHLNGSEFNPYDVTQYTQGGWINSYTFVDDHDGTLYAMARDPEGAFDFDALNVTVENVDPSVSIHTMDMVANVTFEVERSTGPPWYDNNFTFVLQSTDKFDLEVPCFFTELNFAGSTETTVNHIQENMMFDLLKNWKIYANTTSQVSGSVKYWLTFEFKDGKQEVISSEWISSGYAYWEKSLDELWYDETNFTIGHPVEAGVSIWDPSTDDVYLDLNYTVDMVVEIQCTDTLPISKSFNISDTYFYDVYIYESNGKKYVNITAYTQLASSDEINNEGFPLDAHTTYTLEPLIDLTELLVNHPDGSLLSGFSVVECISALNGLNTYAEDDDGGSSPVVSIKFDTQDDIDIKALCPDIDMINNDGGMMTQNISFYLDYYYRSYFRDGSDVTFEQVSTYQDSDQETSFNSFGDPISFAGSGCDSEYITTTNQSTDSGVDMGSTYNELNIIDSSGTDSGSGYRSKEQDTISGSGDPQHPVNLGSYVTSSQQVYTDNTDRSKTSSKDTTENHYPGNPGESFRGQPLGSNPDNWVTVEDDAGSFIEIDTGTVGGHTDWACFFYDGGGDLMMYRNWGSDYEETQVQFWLYYIGADVYVRFENDPTWSCGIQFQQNGVYRRYKSGLTWYWGLVYSGCTDNTWYNVGFELRTSDTYCVTIGDTNGNQIWSGVFDIQSGYATAWDRIEIWAKDTAGYIFIDGYGETHDSGYSYGQNVFPYQQCTLSSFSVPMQGMHVDNYARRTGTYYLEYRVKVNYAGAGCESPDIYLYIDGQYISAGTIADPSDNVWYTKQIAIQNTQFSGDYDVDLYFKALTEDINAKTQGYTLYVDWVKTKWQYQYYNGPDAYYREPGQNVAAGTLDRSVSVCNNFQRDHGSFTYDIQFSLSQTKQYYVQLYKFIGVFPGWRTIYSGTSSGSKSWINVPLSSDYVEDDEDPQVKLRIYTTGGGNPFNLLLTEFQIHYQYSYTYYYRHTVDLNNMNEFRYRALDMARGIDMDFDYYFPLEDRDGDIKHKQQNTAAQWQQVGLYDNVGDDLFDYTFLNKDFILYDGSFYVYHEQEIVDHDPDGHATECELDSMSHYYEWDYSYCDIFSLELSDMNDFRYDHFTSCDINYEVKTHNSEGLNIRVYNHATYEWDTLDSFTTNGADPDQPLVGTDGFVNFVSDDYILYEASSGKYLVNVSFTGFANPSETIFDIATLEAEWDYSYTWDDQFNITLTNMNDFRYDNFEQGTLSYTISTRSGEPVDIHLWDYTISDWVYQETVNAGPSYSDTITLTSNSDNKYIDSSTYNMTVWFELTQFNPPTSYANSEFDLDSMSVSWEYNFTYYDTYQSQIAEMTQFRYDTFTECLVSYNIDLIRDGKSTDVYLYNFSKSDWDFFKTTSPPQGGAGIEDFFTFYSTDYIDSGTYNVRIKFTGFTDTEFALNSIGYTFEWEYDVQDKFTANYDMDAHMYNTYELCTITYSIITSESQSNVQVKLYNYSSSQFVSVGSPFATTADVEYEGSVQFTSDEFIHSTEYTTRVYFVVQDSYLTLNWMTTNYSWSYFYSYCDFGHDNQGMEGIPYADMTAMYRNVYNASEVFDYAGMYLVTWTVSDGVHETIQGQLIEVVYPLPSVAIGELPDYIIEDQQIPFEANIDLAEGFSYLPPELVFAHLTDFTSPQQQEFDIDKGTWSTFPEDSLEFNDDEYATISADPESGYVSPTSGDFNVISGDLTYGDLEHIDDINSTITPSSEVVGVPTLEGWDYVRNITLSPSTPENNYQVKVQLSSSNFEYSKVKSDGADLRFYTNDETLLDYWIESWNTTGDSLIWVEVPDSGTTVIHMYYGNSAATAMSNGTNTFSFFDDFEGTSLDTNVWNEHKVTRSGTFSVTVENSLVKLLMNFGGGEMRGPWTTVGYSDFYTTGGGYGTYCTNGINALALNTYTHEDSVAQVFTDVRGSEWTWLIDDMYYLSDSLVKFYENGTLISTHDESIPDANSIPIKFMCRGWDYPNGRHYMNAIRTNNNLNEMGTALRILSRQEWDLGSDNDEIKVWVDWVFIHEVNETEPVASVGSELDAEYTVEAEVEWSVDDPQLLSIEALRFNHNGPANMDFYIWNYTLGDWVDITLESSPYTLTTDLYNSNTIKILYNATSSNSFDIDIDQLRIDYTKDSLYKIDTSVEWSVSDPELYSMDALRFDHTAPISIDFYIWNYTLGDWLDITSETSPYALTTDLYNTTTNSVKVRYVSDNSVSQFDLQLNQLRIDYTKEIARVTCKDIYQYYWDFGDGYFSVDRNPDHQYGYDGNYTAMLCVRDLYGNCYNDSVIVEVEEKYPEIIGPYGFSGIEGQSIVLDVAVSDSIFDRKDLTFTWYDENDQEITEFANNQKPIVILNDGVYNYSLEVEDIDGYKDSADILITVNDIPPYVFIQNYMYHGDANSGSLTLTAYAFDCSEDINTLEFTWRIAHNYTVDNRGPFSNVNRSSITFDATKTAIYQGEVSVRDPSTNIINKQVFYISSVIDSNGNGFSDEFEQELAENGENIYDYFDTDKDGISDLYEITHNETDYLDPDTDKDGLYDGIDRSTGMGERPAGTNPIDYDSDDDLLSDGEEVYGWEISTDLEDNIHVSSDPWLNDTDNDGWTDYEEYSYGTHPRNADTDLDGVNDPQDPFPLEADKDEDGLLDSEELAVGTACDNADTDEDTLTDAEEIRGGITDPLSADTDRDFLSDGAEVIVKTNSIQNRLNLDQPVIISFNHYFQHASTAQISLVLAFGEFNGTINYGIEDVPDLNVKVSKMDNNLVLYEGNTNGDRYFSHAIDFREVIENKGYNYYGDYVISVDKTDVGCMLEQFDINVAGLLDPKDADSDNDGIMDGIEMDTLTRGTSVINFASNYESNNITINNIAPPERYNFNIEVGSVQLSNTIDQSVVASITFQNEFWFPVVVAYIVSRNEGDSVEVRIDNITSSGCDIFMEEPGNGGHASETINYIAVEYGEWEFPDGTDIKAGILATDQAHQGGSSYSNWEQVNFDRPFYADPVVLHSLNTYNNEEFKTSIVSEITKSSFNVTQESAETGTSTAEETIGWIAIDPGKTGTIDNIKYETLRGNDGDSDGVTPSDNGHVFSFQQSFTSIPDVVVTKQLTANENDGSWARSDGVLTSSSHRTCAEEDQIGDSERNHADEYFGLVAFEEEFSFGYDYEYIEEPSSSYVKSVEHFELTFTGASSSAQLSKNQNVTNCVPFVTMKQSVGDDWDGIMCDVYFTDSPATVVAERATSGASITLSIYVVEFDGTNVEVQNGAFSATGTYDEQTIDQIDTSKAVPIAYYKVAGGDDDWDSSMVTTDFVGTSTVRMERHASSGTMSGHYYAFETQNSEFSVQKAELSLTTSDGYDTASINWVNMSKSFIVSSYECDVADDNPEDAAVDVWLSSETEVRAERHPESSYVNGAPTINVFVITFSGDEDESVQRGDFTWGNADSFKETDIMDINLDYSMVKSGQMYGIIQCDGFGSADVMPSFVEHKFVDSNTIRLERYTNDEDGIGHWEVVEFFSAPEVVEEPEPEPEPEPFDTHYFSIKIPDRGTVYDANLTVTVESENTPVGYGTVNITLLKEDINCNIDDVVLIDYDTEFNITDVYFNQFIDLTDKVNDETIHRFYGTYRLEIVIFDSSSDDVFKVTQFIIETDTYIQASDDDQNVWITDPSNPDTDGDTVSDYAEIYGWTRGSDTFYTNPLSADSDGDGAKDIIDRHPTENVMIKISPLSATHRSQAYWEASPKLEITISYELNGDYDNRYKIFSPAIRATEDLWSKVILFIRYSHHRRTNFAANDIHYYVDIDDNPNVQPENMDFGFSLWHMEVVDFFGIPLWDNWLAGESVMYSIGDIGHSTTFDISDVGIWGQDNELHVKVETISVEKSKTIAIYDNETMFNGHYKEKEKMNVIILEVTGDVTGTPFVQGPNAIVIPTDLFVETKLNSYLERDKLEDTPLYSAVEGEYEFISVGRNGTTEEGCDEVDFVIIRFNINVADAMTVLSMLLTIIVNDTTGEEVEKYEYQSTKEDGADAVLMNLYKEVLGYIPWFCNFENSGQGDEPDDFIEFWAEVFIGAVMAVVYFVYMIGMAIAELFMAFVKFITAVVMAVLTFLGPLLWLIIRAILLILAFILLALHLVAQIPLYLMMGVSMLIVTALMGGYCEFSWNFVEFSLDNKKVFRMQSDIVWVYWEFFDMKFPWVDDKIIIDGEVIMSSKESILGIDTETETDISEIDMFSEITQTPPSLQCGYNHTSGSTYNFYTTYQDFENNAPDPSYGVKLHLIKPDGNALASYQMSVHPDYVGSSDYDGGILYNHTIDLYTIYQEQGLWHYYFTTQDNSSVHDTVFMPQDGYMLGPINSSCQHLLSETVSTNYPDEYSRPSGFKTDNFTFVSTWWSEIVPDNVYMCLVPANVITGTGVSKTVGIQKFEMSPIDQSPDYNYFVDYYCNVNFTELGYSDEEIGRFNHYYEAIYDNGNKTYLYSFGEDVESEEYWDLYYYDFRTPYVGSPEAQLLDYQFDGANFLSSSLLNLARRDSTLTKNWILISEMQLRFEVIYMDPSGNPPLENYPQLTFVRVSNGEELTPYVMDEKISSEFSTEYGFEVYSYSCVIDVFDLPPGVWKFKFDAKDSNELPVDTLYGDEKLWMWGGATEMMSGFSSATLNAGMIPLIGYACALPMGKGGTWASVAAAILAIVSTGYAIYHLASSWWSFVESKNAGALLGLCLGTFFSCLATSNAFASSFGKIAKYISNIFVYLMLVDFAVSAVTIPLQFLDVPWANDVALVLNWMYLPIEFFLLIAMSISCGVTMQYFGKQTTTENKVIKACMKLMLIFQALVSIASMIAWVTITEGWYLF